MGLSGVANQGCDIGGFDGPAPEPELFVRWVQNGIFQPRFSIHSCNTDNTVTEPWMYPAYTKYISKAIQLRYSLTPYFYSLLHEAATTGAPIMRPLVYEFQDDREVLNESFEFMLGPSLLIANVLDKGVDQLDVYLPLGSDWLNLETNEYIRGGSHIGVPVDLGSIPMFLRTGGIVPTSPGITNLHQQTIDHIDLLVEPSQAHSFRLYEDDGVSMDYQSGKYRETLISVRAQGQSTCVDFASRGTFETRVKDMTLKVLCRDIAPLAVSIDSQPSERFLNYDKFCRAKEGWFFDGQTRQALVKYPTPGSERYSVELTFAAKDLISI